MPLARGSAVCEQNASHNTQILACFSRQLAIRLSAFPQKQSSVIKGTHATTKWRCTKSDDNRCTSKVTPLIVSYRYVSDHLYLGRLLAATGGPGSPELALDDDDEDDDDDGRRQRRRPTTRRRSPTTSSTTSSMSRAFSLLAAGTAARRRQRGEGARLPISGPFIAKAP